MELHIIDHSPQDVFGLLTVVRAREIRVQGLGILALKIDPEWKSIN